MKIRKTQSELLPYALQLEEPRNPEIFRLMAFALAFITFSFLVWTSLTPIHEIARAPGEVIPSSYVKIVQHPDGGVIDEILVKEGDFVNKGQLLMRLNGEGLREDLSRAKARQDVLQMQEERMRAFIEGRQPDFTRFGTSDEKTIADQSSFFKTMHEAHANDRSIIQRQIEQKTLMLQSLRSDLSTEVEKYNIEKSLHEKRAALHKKGFYSDARYLQSKQALATLGGDVRQARGRIAETESEIAEYENRLRSLGSRDGDSVNTKLDAVVSELQQNAETIKKLTDKVNRLDIRAAENGYIKGLSVNTIGAVARPAEALLEIVPANEEMVVEVKIQPQYIARLKSGQPVNVRVSSYDFSKEGYIKGRIDTLSPTTFSGDGGERFYKGRILLDAGHVGKNPENKVMPGMTVMAEIITGQKTILQYLLKPVHNALHTAMTEK